MPPVHSDNLEAQYKYRRKSRIIQPDEAVVLNSKKQTMPMASSSLYSLEATSGGTLHNGISSPLEAKVINRKQTIAVPSSLQEKGDVGSGNARHIDVSSSAFEGHVSRNNADIIGRKFFKTMDPNFHQAPAEYDDTDDIVRNISEEDERKADAESAYDYYMKMSRDGTPPEERPAATVPLSNGGGGMLITPPSTGLGGDDENQQNVGRPIGSSTDMMISKRGSVSGDVKAKKIGKPTANHKEQTVISKRGPKAVKKKIAASKRNQSTETTETIQPDSTHNVTSQSEAIQNRNSQSGSSRNVKNRSKSTTANVRSQSGSVHAQKNQSNSRKEILKVVDLSRIPASTFFANNTNTFIEKDDLILNYAKRYRNTGRLVADFSNGPENAKLLVYDLNFGRRPENRRRDSISDNKMFGRQQQGRRSQEDMLNDTVERLKRTFRHRAAEKMVDVDAEKRMIGKRAVFKSLIKPQQFNS